MKTLSTAILAMAVVFAVGTASGQAANPSKGNGGAQAACCMDSKAQMGQMDEHMQRMQALHDKMASAATPEERQKLMAEQRQEMQQGMGMMQQMHGGAMMGGAMMGGGAKGATIGQKGEPADQKTQMQMMEKRMDMMQMMMQSMMDQQGAVPAAPAK